MVRVILPFHLRTLANVGKEVSVDVAGVVTPATILDAIEQAHPVLKGTIRTHENGKRRAFLRFFVCGKDISMEPMDAPLPAAIGAGEAPFMVVGAIAGG